MDDDGKVVGIFKVEGLKNKSCAKFIHEANVTLKSQQSICNVLKKRIELGDRLVCRFWRIMVTDAQLMSNLKQPLYSVTVMHEIPFRPMIVCSYTLSFINKSNVNNVEELLSNELDGEFILEATIGKHTQQLSLNWDKFPGEDEWINQFTFLLKSSLIRNYLMEIVKNARETAAKNDKRMQDTDQLEKTESISRMVKPFIKK